MTIVTVLLDSSDARSLVGWADRFGQALEEDVVFVLAGDAELRSVLDLAAAELSLTLSDLDDVSSEEPAPSPRVVALEELAAADLAAKVLELTAAPGVTHLLLAKEKKSNRRRSAIARALFDRAPCRVILLRPGRSDPEATGSIMVAASGGPHASAALRIGARLALTEDRVVTPVYVEPPFSREAEQVGEFVMKKILKDADLGEGDHIVPKVVVAADPVRGIVKASEEQPDLILLGASEAGAVRRSLFGTIPERYLGRDEGGAIGVVRERRPLGHRLKARLERWLDLTIPQLSRGERVALFEKIRSGSSWRFDFMILIALSTSIATLGLLQDSTAVVIGAMLVAPLMMPLVGAGLAVVQGNLPLLRMSAQAIALGFLAALGIGVVFGWLVPIPDLTNELLARGGPTLLDLGIAFLSGFAAAYCLGRPTLSAALPGVAIAAALVPPIATAGVSIAHGEYENAQGAALLFGTNVVAIVIGAALSLYGGGIRPKRLQAGERPWARYALVLLLVAAAALSIPLGAGLVTTLRGAAALPTADRVALEESVHAWGARVRRATWVSSEPAILQVVVEGPTKPTPGQLRELKKQLTVLGGKFKLRVKTELVVDEPDL